MCVDYLLQLLRDLRHRAGLQSKEPRRYAAGRRYS